MSGLWLILTMAVFGHRGRRNKKTSVGTLPYLMCLFIINSASLLEAPEVSLQPNKTCKPDEFLTADKICCNKCSPGFKLQEQCHTSTERSNCIPCPDGQYTDQMNYSPNCRPCKTCKESKHEIVESPCKRYQNTICQCEDGYYRFKIDSVTSECLRCKKCKADEVEKRACRPDNNTVCGCKDDYHKVSGKCEPCKSCSSECSSFCKSPTTVSHEVTKPVNLHDHIVNIIGGIVAAIIILLVLVVSMTYVVTKRYTKKRLLRSSQRSDTSQESCEQVLVNCEEHLDTSVKAFPQSSVAQVEGSTLPDCVPLEINLSDLIYAVLDLVPVLQVKQLVRSLGVTDTEIEQAEMDYRSCREAHYQMLRVWASRSGRGGHGGMLHRPLLKELLEKLRMMNLGKAAEELETKYGIQ